MGKPELLESVYSQKTVICFLPLWKKRELSETLNCTDQRQKKYLN